MAPPHNGNIATPFVDLIKLEKIDETTFSSTALPFAPGGRHPRAVGAAYGGHVFTQSAWAACQTVQQGLLLYNVTGHFILPGRPDVPFHYKVHRIRDGKSSCTRIVHATQEGSSEICFTCTCAFRKEEHSPMEVQTDENLWTTYANVLRGKRPGSFPTVPGMDIPWYLEYLRNGGLDEDFPGLEMTQVPMQKYNENRHPLDRRQLMFYRPREVLPPDPNLHLCAHLYASDRNGLYILADFLRISDIYTQMGSLVHSVIFHSPAEQLVFGDTQGEKEDHMLDPDGKGRWFGWEIRTDRAGGGRMMMHSRLWGPGGVHVATITQDGMTRVSNKPQATKEEIELVRSRMRSWKAREKL